VSLTRGRRRVLDLIGASIRERGTAPTLHELSAALRHFWGRRGAGNTNTHRLVQALIRSGHLLRPAYGLKDILVADPQQRMKRPVDWDNLRDQILAAKYAGSMLVAIPVEVALGWHDYTVLLERTVLVSDLRGSDAPVRNRWDGICVKCGLEVERGVGVALKVGGKWAVHHDHHSGLTLEQLAGLPAVGPKAPTEEERAARKARKA
jgi:hypothetical protein